MSEGERVRGSEGSNPQQRSEFIFFIFFHKTNRQRAGPRVRIPSNIQISFFFHFFSRDKGTARGSDGSNHQQRSDFICFFIIFHTDKWTARGSEGSNPMQLSDFPHYFSHKFQLVSGPKARELPKSVPSSIATRSERVSTTSPFYYWGSGVSCRCALLVGWWFLCENSQNQPFPCSNPGNVQVSFSHYFSHKFQLASGPTGGRVGSPQVSAKVDREAKRAGFH